MFLPAELQRPECRHFVIAEASQYQKTQHCQLNPEECDNQCPVAMRQLMPLQLNLLGLLPAGPMYYPDGEITDEPTETLIAELIREAALEGVRDELPHSIAVTIDEILPRPDRPEDKPLTDVFASIVVERESQKGIIIGHKGARLREIGTTAREQINRLLGTRVHLNLHVKVLKEWQRDAKYLNRLGF